MNDSPVRTRPSASVLLHSATREGAGCSGRSARSERPVGRRRAARRPAVAAAAAAIAAICCGGGAFALATPPIAPAPPPAAVPTPATAAMAVQQALSPPELVIATPERDLGGIGFGTEPIIEFSLKNAGARPLTIAVGPLPKGLKLSHVDREIAPAGTGIVRLQMDTFVVDEVREWRVPLETNDPLHATAQLIVRADLRAYLALTPATARFTFVQFGREGGTTHLLSSADGAPMELLGVDSPFDYIRATARELTGADRDPDRPGRQWRISLTISGRAPVGPIAGYVIARTTHPRQPRAFLPVSGFVRPLFAVTPPTVDLHDVRTSATDQPLLESLLVKNFGEAPVAITGVSSDIAGLDAAISEVQVGHTWKVELRMSARAGAAGPFSGTLRLKTTSAHMPEVTVPIQGTRLHDAQP